MRRGSAIARTGEGKHSGIMEKPPVTSGVEELDRLLGGLFIGDNVVWLDDSGSLASVFCHNFILASQQGGRPIIYVSFDRSPRNLLENLGPLARNPSLVVLDCFTWGKGAGSSTFLKFYKDPEPQWPCRILPVEEPCNVERFTEVLYGVHGGMEGDVRLVFESITGMQEAWGGEDSILNFYAHSCPRLYELNTIAYWIMEKEAHSSLLRAHISRIAQVVIELGVRRGATSLAILKADRRDVENLQQSRPYWAKGLAVAIDAPKGARSAIDLGSRLKALRTKRGMSQSELARLVGVTPGAVSQVESNLVYPSIPALLKMAEALSVDVSSFFQEKPGPRKRFVFPSSEAVEAKCEGAPEGSVTARRLLPVDFDSKAEPLLVEILPHTTLSSHFFVHKGEEFGWMVSGKLHAEVEKTLYTLHPGDAVYVSSETPSRWKNPGPRSAKILWVKIR